MSAYRLLVEEAHDLISAHTADKRVVFLYASTGFDRMLGIDPSVRGASAEAPIRSVHATVQTSIGVARLACEMLASVGAYARIDIGRQAAMPDVLARRAFRGFLP